MKLLHEIVQAEIARCYPLVFANADLVAVANKKTAAVVQRLTEDRALAILAETMTQIIVAGSKLNLPEEGKKEAYRQIIVDTVTIWENTHNSFNEQLKPKQCE